MNLVQLLRWIASAGFYLSRDLGYVFPSHAVGKTRSPFLTTAPHS